MIGAGREMLRTEWYLTAIPGMVASIRKGMETPADEMSEEPGW